MSLLLNQKFILSLLLISAMVSTVSLYQREIGTDDAWFAEQSYWFAKNGYVKSELFRGLNNVEDRHLAYHRLHVWQGALAYKLFGWSAYVFKTIMLVYLVVFLLASYLLIKKYQLFESRLEYYLFYTFISCYSILAILFFTNRPDITIMTFGFLSFCMLFSALKEDALYKPLLAGVFAGLAVLTHLNGLVFMLAGGCLLLFEKRFRSLVIFSVAGILVSLVYFIILHDASDINLYLQQMRDNPALHEDDFGIWGTISKVLHGYRPYFHKGSDASYTLLFITMLWLGRKRIIQNDDLRKIFIYFISIAISLAAISPGYKSLYLVYHAPYVFLMLTILYRYVVEQEVSKRKLLVTLLVLFFFTQWGEVLSLLNKRTPQLADVHAEVSRSMGLQPGERIVAPIIFVFNGMDKYTIQSFHLYRAISGQRKIQLEKDFFRVTSEDKRTHLILTDHHLRDLGISGAVKGDRFGDYLYTGRHGPYHGFTLAPFRDRRPHPAARSPDPARGPAGQGPVPG